MHQLGRGAVAATLLAVLQVATPAAAAAGADTPAKLLLLEFLAAKGDIACILSYGAACSQQAVFRINQLASSVNRTPLLREVEVKLTHPKQHPAC